MYYYVLKCEIIKKIFKLIFHRLTVQWKSQVKLWYWEWMYLVHPLCLI